MNKRTPISFPYSESIWPTVEKWAVENGFKPVFQSSTERIFQKGVGFLVAPMMLSISQKREEVRGEAWIRSGLLVRIFSMFMLPPEMGIEPGGIKGVLPRKIARTAVNNLLARLGQKSIG